MADAHSGAGLASLPDQALDLIPAAVFMVTVPDGHIVRWNRRAAELCELAPLATRRLTDMLRGVDPLRDGTVGGTDPVRAAIESGTALDSADAVLWVAGRTSPMTVSVSSVLDEPDSAALAVVLCQGSGRWKDAAARLQRSDQRLGLALSAARLGSWEYDLRTRVLTASAQCKANHGFAPDADMQFDTDIVPAVHPEYREGLRTVIQRTVETEGSFEIEVPHRWPDGSDHWILIAGRVVDPTCMVGVSKDITERRQAELVLRENEERLREADRLKDEFLAVVAHELRGPIAPVLTAVRLLQLKGPPDSALQKLRETILRQTLQLAKVVDDLLEIGRITAGKLRLDTARVELGAVVRQAIETAAPAIERGHHSLVANIPAQPIFLEGDSGRLVQVLTNLLNNAAKYSSEPGRIEVTVDRDDGDAVVRVRDDGVGIAPDMLDRIFERFVQVGSPVEQTHGGLGIGLSIVKAVVEMHGGTVHASSAGRGTGSTFTVRLPVEPNPQRTSRRAPSGAGAIRQRDEDDAANQRDDAENRG
jgi:PAS domain S-box-containing protein